MAWCFFNTIFQRPTIITPLYATIMVSLRRLELVAALLVGAAVLFVAGDVDIDENLVAMRRADTDAYKVNAEVTTVRQGDNLASPGGNPAPPTSTLSLPVPLMERRALRTTTDEGRRHVRGVAEIRNERSHGQRQGHHHRSDKNKKSGTRDSEESFSAFSVRHSPCEQIEIPASYLIASETTQSNHLPENVIDGDLETHWVTEGLGSWLMVDLPEATALQGVAVAFAGNPDGSRDDSQSFTMIVLGDNQMIHRPALNAGASRGLEYFGFEREVLARSVVFVGYGRQGHTSLAEMKLCRASLPPKDPKDHAQEEEDGNGDRHQRTGLRAVKNLRG